MPTSCVSVYYTQTPSSRASCTLAGYNNTYVSSPSVRAATGWWLPGLAQLLGGKVEAAFIAGHVILSITAIAVGFGYLPSSSLSKTVLAPRRRVSAQAPCKPSLLAVVRNL